jgi:hypothetical protein
MNLEQRLIQTLHRADDFEPSPDLFARVERSLEEDLKHRRRVRMVTLGLIAGVVAISTFFRAVTSVAPGGSLVVPGWSLWLVTVLVQVAVVVTLGPTLRRFGKPFVADVFRFDPDTGWRFMRLLDIAFYLFLFGAILIRSDVQSWDRTLVLASDAWEWTARVAFFLLMLGVAHAFTIATLPLVGLFFSSSMRRVRRLEAGSAAPESLPRAERAERVVRLIVWGIAGSALALVVIGIVVIGGVGVLSP